jgi:beta-galactosidase
MPRFLAVLLSLVLSLSALASDRLTLNFNPDWKFLKADPAGAATPTFDDHGWTTVSTPHTYNDTDTFDNWSLAGHRGEQDQWSGRTWYRKTFALPDSFKGKKVFIEFEAVRQVAEVYLNGHLLGVSKTGFIPFGFDLSPYLRFGTEQNVLAVMCDNRFVKDPVDPNMAPQAATTEATHPNLGQLSADVNASIPDDVDKIRADQIPWNNPHWHPAHGGIYRNVRLYVTDPLHISLPLYSFLQTAGPYVYATDITAASAQLHVEVPVQNERITNEDVALQVEVFDADGKSVLSLEHSGPIAAGGHDEFAVTGSIAHPRLWEPAYPHLYRVVCSLRVGGEIVDTYEISSGIRAVQWDALTGFYINGHHEKIHGWGQKPTDEWPGLGAAQPDWMHFYTLQLMQEAGGNWIRWGHCAGSSAMINAGDRLGIMAEQPGVDGESDTVGAAWKIRAAAFRDMIIYFRNHPSIMIWEGGNQKVTHDHAKELRGYMDQYDPHGGRAYAHRRPDQITAEFMDVDIGTEGGREIARLPVVEGEYDREESPRRVWDDFSPPNFGYPEAKGQAYQLTSEQYAVNQVGQYVRKVGAPNHCGGANWIFSDSTSGGRDAAEVARAGGEVDGVRLPKEGYYVCQTMFRDDPQVHIIGHWTYPAGTKKTVYVTSNGDDVELLVNGKSLGHGKVSDRYLFTFPDVAWEPGEIKAIAYKNEKPIATDAKHTIGPAVALRLTKITGPGGLQADGSDIALVDVEAVDKNGERCPTFQQRVDFSFAGPGIWRGGYNSGKIKSTNNTWLDLECGINRVAVRSTLTAGSVNLTAKCDGLISSHITIDSQPIELTDGFTTAMPTLPPVVLPELSTSIKDAWTHIAELKTSTGSTAVAMAGQFTKTLSYSGPTTIAHLEQNAHDGENIYVDRDYSFAGLPPELVGADWFQAPDSDAFYSAVDLIQIAVNAGTRVFVAHDDRLPRPPWLTSQFQPTSLSLTVNGYPMKIFQHTAGSEESLTLGSNAEDPNVKTGNMYVVFVNAAR